MEKIEDCVLVGTIPIYHLGLTSQCDAQTYTCDAMNMLLAGSSTRDFPAVGNRPTSFFPFQLQHLFRHGMIINCEISPALAILLCGDIV